jgi:hypothetical protein
MRIVEDYSTDLLWSSARDEGAEIDERKCFEDGFATALGRLEQSGGDADPWQEDNLLSALGAAAMRSWALATAFVTTAAAKPIGRRGMTRSARRTPLPLSILRRRFEQIRAVA